MTPASLLREARQASGLTQTQLAARLATSQPAVARLERPGANPTWTTFVRALRAAGYGIELRTLAEPAVELDLDQLRERLAMSPAERLQTFQESQASLSRLSASARRRGR